MIKVKPITENKFEITVKEEGSQTKHQVTLSSEYYQELTQGEISKKELLIGTSIVSEDTYKCYLMEVEV